MRRENGYRLATVLPMVIASALVLGFWVGETGEIGVAIVFGILSIAFLIWQGPFFSFCIWLFVSPLTQGQTIDLGFGIPDLSVDRIFLLLMIMLVTSEVVSRRRRLVPLLFQDVLIIAFAVWIVVSIPFYASPVDPPELLRMLLQWYLLPFLAYFVTRNIVTSEAALRRVLQVFLVIWFILALPTLVETLTGYTILGVPSEQIAGVYRVQSFMRSAWEFGTYGNMLLFLAFHSFLGGVGFWQRRLGILSLAVGLLAVLTSFMRGSWLALAGGLFVIAVLSPNRQWRRIIVLTVAIFGLLVLINWSSLPQSDVWVSRIIESENIIARQMGLQQLWDMFRARPLLGWGVRETMLVAQRGEVVSHISFLSNLMHFGLWGFVYLGSVLVTLWQGIRIYRGLPRERFIGKELMAILLASATTFLIEAMTWDTNRVTSVSLLFWVVLGLIASIERLSEGKQVHA